MRVTSHRPIGLSVALVVALAACGGGNGDSAEIKAGIWETPAGDLTFVVSSGPSIQEISHEYTCGSITMSYETEFESPARIDGATFTYEQESYELVVDFAREGDRASGSWSASNIAGECSESWEVTWTSPAQALEERSSAPSSAAPAAVQELVPSAVVCSSQLPPYPCENLIDGSPETVWNDDGLKGVGAEIVFRFDQLVSIELLAITNAPDEDTFHRNFRVRGYEILTNDANVLVGGELADTQDPQQIAIGGAEAISVTLRVTSTYPAEAWDSQSAFTELAIAEVTLFGSQQSQ